MFAACPSRHRADVWRIPLLAHRFALRDGFSELQRSSKSGKAFANGVCERALAAVNCIVRRHCIVDALRQSLAYYGPSARRFVCLRGGCVRRTLPVSH